MSPGLGTYVPFLFASLNQGLTPATLCTPVRPHCVPHPSASESSEPACVCWPLKGSPTELGVVTQGHSSQDLRKHPHESRAAWGGNHATLGKVAWRGMCAAQALQLEIQLENVPSFPSSISLCLRERDSVGDPCLSPPQTAPLSETQGFGWVRDPDPRSRPDGGQPARSLHTGRRQGPTSLVLCSFAAPARKASSGTFLFSL